MLAHKKFKLENIYKNQACKWNKNGKS